MITVTKEKICVDALRAAVLSPQCGAVVTFEGIVRDHDENEKVFAITYEAYELMAQKEMEKIVSEISKQYPEVNLVAVHRVGYLKVGEVSVVVIACAPHRKEAFLAGQKAIDQIKEKVPIWKKQETPNKTYWKGAC